MPKQVAPDVRGLEGDDAAARIASILALVRAEKVMIGDVEGRDTVDWGHLDEAEHHLRAALGELEASDE